MSASRATPGVLPDGVHELRRVWEPEGDPQGVVVVVHGLGEHSGRYERTGSLLAEAGFSVRSFDLIGFGATGGTRAYVDSWSVLLDQVETHMSAAKETGLPVVLLGHSLGGLIALEYTLSERVAPDLLVVSAPGLAGGAAWQRMTAPIAAAIGPKLMVPNALKGEQLSRDPAVGEQYFADPLVLTKSTAKLGAEIFAAMDRTNAAVHSLNVPTLVIHGGMDTIVPPPATAHLASLPGVERHLYPTLRHESFNEPEGPDVVADMVAWIEKSLSTLG